MKVRMTMEFTPEQVEALAGDSDDKRNSILGFMLIAVEGKLPEAMKEYRERQIVDLKEQIAELEADD